MRRLLISVVAVVMLAALIPNTALAGKPLRAPTSNAFVYLGRSGNIVSSGDYYSTPPAGWHVCNTRDGDKDYVFLASLKITGPGTWDTVAGDGTWAIGVTTTLHGKLINNADSSISTMDVANGLRLYLHLAGDGYLYDGAGMVTHLRLRRRMVARMPVSPCR
jgi:hypothetical protein